MRGWRCSRPASRSGRPGPCSPGAASARWSRRWRGRRSRSCSSRSAQTRRHTHLVYGFWQPQDVGARPLGPFINRNHAGTWSLLVLFLVFGCLQWRRGRSSSPSRGWSWRARVAHALNGRSLILVLSTFLLIVSVAVGASRSTMLALTCAAGYVALAAPRRDGASRSSLWTRRDRAGGWLGVIAYADLDRLLSRLDETRQLGLAHRVAIWRDSLRYRPRLSLDGNRGWDVCQRDAALSDHRPNLLLERSPQPVPPARGRGRAAAGDPGADRARRAGGAPACARCGRPTARCTGCGSAPSASLVAVAVQSIWETGLTLPANGMLAARGGRHPRPRARGTTRMLRLGIDVDGVVADFRTAFRALAERELGIAPDDVEKRAVEAGRRAAVAQRVRRLELVARRPRVRTRSDRAGSYAQVRRARWEVFFMTSRPPSAGDSVQLQTQVWLERYGFYLPRVLTTPSGARGELARALRLDLALDDRLVNCLEIISASNAKALMVLRAPSRAASRRDRRGARHRRGLDARGRRSTQSSGSTSCCRHAAAVWCG